MFDCLRLYGLWCLCLLVQLSTPAHAHTTTAHWHCSKQAPNAALEQPLTSPNNDVFDLSTTATNVVGVSLTDLMDVYSGRPVYMGNRHLTACFMAGQTSLNQSAYTRIGMQWTALQQLQRRSAIAQSHLRMVTSEAEMLQCIAQYSPAVGYLSHPTVTEQVSPCF